MALEAEADGGSETAAGAKKDGKRRLIMIGGAVGAALLIAGAGGYFFLSSQKAPVPAAEAEALAAPESFIFNLPEITVNLSSADGKESFMKLTIALEVAD